MERFSVLDGVDVLRDRDVVVPLICGRRNADVLRLVDPERSPQSPLAIERQTSALQESVSRPHSSYGESADTGASDTTRNLSTTGTKSPLRER